LSVSFDSYPQDIVVKVLNQYQADALEQVHLWLEDIAPLEGPDSFRLRRCVLSVADGSMAELESAVSLGLTDYRDLIVSAEYDREGNRLRDLSLPFA
jgi:hypothetical protein